MLCSNGILNASSVLKFESPYNSHLNTSMSSLRGGIVVVVYIDLAYIVGIVVSSE